MADDNDKDSSEKESPSANYVRKKNLIPGIDNDHLIIGMLGLLGAAVAAPHIKNAIEGIVRQYQPQFPPNGVQQPQQQPVYLPPATQMPVPQEENHSNEHTPLSEHERSMQEQKAYEAALEKESVTGSQSITMVPDRSTQVSKNKNKGNYEAGSNISGSYS